MLSMTATFRDNAPAHPNPSTLTVRFDRQPIVIETDERHAEWNNHPSLAATTTSSFGSLTKISTDRHPRLSAVRAHLATGVVFGLVVATKSQSDAVARRSRTRRQYRQSKRRCPATWRWRAQPASR